MTSVPSRPTVRRLPLVWALLGTALALSPAFSTALAQGAEREDDPAAEAAGPDTRPPLIEFEALAESVADRSQVFTVQVADDRTLESVSLYHRRAGEVPFVRADMAPLGGTGYFSVSIPTEPDDLRSIEYYVQAVDEGGNRTVEGYAFDPFRRELTAASEPLASRPAIVEEAGDPSGRADAARDRAIVARGATGDGAAIETSSRRPWWAIALGVVAIGTIAAIASDGGEDGDDREGGDGTVPLVIGVETPAAR